MALAINVMHGRGPSNKQLQPKKTKAVLAVDIAAKGAVHY